MQLEQGDQPSVCQGVLHEDLPPDEYSTAIDCGLQGQTEQGKGWSSGQRNLPDACLREPARPVLLPTVIVQERVTNEVGNAFFYEFEEFGLNRQLGYASPVDLVERFPDFYWSSVSPHLEEAVACLNLTVGRQWIANLHSHVFCAEHTFALMGPQR